MTDTVRRCSLVIAESGGLRRAQGGRELVELLARARLHEPHAVVQRAVPRAQLGLERLRAALQSHGHARVHVLHARLRVRT